MRRHLIALSLLSAFALSACGVKGELQKAPPMWGDKAKAEQAQKGAQKTSSEN